MNSATSAATGKSGNGEIYQVFAETCDRRHRRRSHLHWLLEQPQTENAEGDHAGEVASFERISTPENIAYKPPAARIWLGRMLLRTHWFTRHVVLDRWFLDTKQSVLVV